MRRSAFVLLPLVATAALFACEDDGSTGSNGTFNPEAGSFEAGTPPAQDASTPPAQDGAVPDAAVPAVTVRVMSLGQPVPNVIVPFNDANGQLLFVGKTGPDGRATSNGPTPAMASALLGRGANFQIVTWTGVEAGDELIAEEQPTSPNITPSYDVAFTLAANATEYDAISGPCQNTGTASPVRLFLYPDCVRTTNPILVRATGGAGVVGFAFKKGNVAPPPDGGIGMVTVGAFANPVSATVDASNLPNEEGDVQVGLTEIAENVGFPLEGTKFLDGPRSFTVPAGFADARQVLATFQSYLTPGAQLTIVKRDVPAQDSVIDLSQRLPKITAASVPPMGDPRRFEVKWTTEQSLAATDGGLVRVRYYTNQDANFSWSFVVPPGAATSGSVKAPQLPDEGASWGPPSLDAGGTSFEEPEILFVDSSTVPSYAAFRKSAATTFNGYEYGRRELNAILPANGTLRATSYERMIAR